MGTVPLDPAQLRRSFPQLRLLILHGSRAREDARATSDWDFAYRADAGLDELSLRAALTRALQTDEIDLVDLDRAGGVLRYRAARDAQVVLEREPGELERFSLAAIRFWLEVEPLLAQSHAAVLDGLG